MSSQTTYRSGVLDNLRPDHGFVTEMVSMVTAAPPLRTEDHARTAYEPGIGGGGDRGGGGGGLFLLGGQLSQSIGQSNLNGPSRSPLPLCGSDAMSCDSTSKGDIGRDMVVRLKRMPSAATPLS